MSVINKMLRDLDKRQAAPAGGPATPLNGARTLGTASVADTARVRRSPGLRKKLSPKLFLVLGACFALLAVGWLWRSGVLSLASVPTAALTRPPEALVVPAPCCLRVNPWRLHQPQSSRPLHRLILPSASKLRGGTPWRRRRHFGTPGRGRRPWTSCNKRYRPLSVPHRRAALAPRKLRCCCRW